MRFPIADVDFDAVMTGNSRPSTAGHDRPLCGDEYGGMKVCNVLLIQIVLSYCLLFGVLTPLKATKIKGHCIEH